MSEMVKRVAKALCREYRLQDGYSQEQADRAAEGGMWKNFIPEATAAIQSMREPTGEMKDAGAASYGIGDVYFGEGAEMLAGQPTKGWQAMIDAALSSPGK